MTRLWKTIDIDDLPKKFFTRKDVHIRILKKPGEWVYDKNSKVGERWKIIEYIQKYGGSYRYMIEPSTVGKVIITKCIIAKLDGDIIEGCEDHDYYYTEDGRIYEVEMIG